MKKATGASPGQHKGGKGDYKEKTKPGYPVKCERCGSTVASPNYPRQNSAGKSSTKKGY